ncbi:hypothetical protein F2Q69_00057298 [Brassica cretica]|uniref:Uncharacterized protein n=1 Tax=Brassica cretica TaxID=69181 RepID=A0A8S9N112_BRACR|nr:hypothetical protein F2Q69_00057298 [Brassica cretica]
MAEHIMTLPLEPQSRTSDFEIASANLHLCLICHHQTSIVQRSLLHILLIFSTWSRHAHHHHFLCVSFDESEHRRHRHGLELTPVVTGFKLRPSRPVVTISRSPRRHRLEVAPSSPSRGRSVVTVSRSLRRHRLEVAPSSPSRARSVVNGLELALSPPLSKIVRR